MVVGLDAQRLDVRVTTLEGDLVRGPDGFVDGDHRLDVQIAGSDGSDVRIVSESAGRTRVTDVSGQLEVEGIRFTVALHRRGERAFESDSAGAQFRDRYTLTGSVEGPDVQATVQETWDYEQVCASGTTRRGYRCASSFRRRFENRWTRGGDEYRLRDGAQNASFRDGKPNASELLSFWMGQGTLLENGEPIGQIVFEPDPTAATLHFYLVSGDERISLQSWPTY